MCYTLLVRAERAKQVSLLKAKGYTYAQIALRLGISESYVRDLVYDPDGSKARTRKDSYRGTCKTCGATTDGSVGPGKAPEYCRRHAARAYYLVWSESRIIGAIHEWNHLYGRPPVAPDWNKQVEGSPGQYVGGPRSVWCGKRRWPPLSIVQKAFGSWANAIEAAGFPRPKIGHYRDESKRSEILTKWTAEAVLEWIREHADGEKGPTSSIKGAPIRAAIREFGSWGDALIAAGYKPNYIVRSTRQ